MAFNQGAGAANYEVATVPVSNRELVESFLCFKLSQNNLPTSLVRPENVAARGGGVEAVIVTLCDASVEFEAGYRRTFKNPILEPLENAQLTYESFKFTMDELFVDGINWGRIIGLFVYGGGMCVECAKSNRGEKIPHIADWMTKYLDEHLNVWIQTNGGWVSQQ
ncbi:apoptosis regulator R11-like [Pholidichthys leucotaenia]